MRRTGRREGGKPFENNTSTLFICNLRYLTPYLAEVKAEKAEREAWGN